MKHQDSSRVIRSVDAAAFLTDPARARFLLPFLARERTLGSVADELGVPVNMVLYRARQMLALDLLLISREEPRAGRAVKHYRSVADEFFVPFGLTPFATVEAQILGLEERSRHLFTRALAQVVQQHRASRAWGTRVYLDAQANPTIDSAPAPGTTAPWPEAEPGMFSTWSTITLSPETARHFSRQLQALRDDLVSQAAAGHDQYIVHLGFVALAADDDT